jgi:uncharacterized protein YbjT (DUF2867 family)
MKTALLFGATGLIGTEVLSQLVKDDRYSTIVIFVRKTLSIRSEKIKEIVVDFDRLEEYSSSISGDDLFCCLGTTIKKAGSQAAFRKVDHDLVFRISQIAAKNGVSNFVVISSLGANASSRNFYLKTKGEMERDVQTVPFKTIRILQPSILTGDRKEFRLGERFGIGVMKLVSPLLVGSFKKYKPIHARTVAKAMIALANSDSNQRIFQSDVIQDLGR